MSYSRAGKITGFLDGIEELEEELTGTDLSTVTWDPDAAEPLDGWPSPEPLQGELPPVEPFSEDLLPAPFRPLVRDIAERMQVPMDYPAAALVACLAGVVNRRARMQPKAEDTTWVVVPNLRGGIIGLPGCMKSPVIQVATGTLNKIQTELRDEYERALKNYELAKEEYELRRAVWSQQFKTSLKKGEAAPEKPQLPEEPKQQRIIVNDATFEALHRIMSENPAGIFAIRDELTGWWSQLDRAGREGERGFCLQAWNGDAGYTIDRIGRGTIHVEACCMSMLGGIQPGRLRSYLAEALNDGPGNDGLIQRFQLLVWPDTDRRWTYVDRPPDPAVEEQTAQVFRRLSQLNPERPARFCFEPDAQKLFIEWSGELESKVRGDELHPAFISHLAKYRSLMPSLAVLFELTDLAAQGFEGFDGSPQGKSAVMQVSIDNTRRAAMCCDYLESHANRVYSCITTPQLRAAQELGAKIKQRKVGAEGFFSCRDVYIKGWSGLDSPPTVKLALEILQDAGWVREVDSEYGRSGRPSDKYAVNPRLWR